MGLAWLGLALLLTFLAGIFSSVLVGLGWPMALFGFVGWLAAVLWLAGRASGRVGSTVGGLGLKSGLPLVGRVGQASGRVTGLV